jgi:hypothetical protein
LREGHIGVGEHHEVGVRHRNQAVHPVRLAVPRRRDDEAYRVAVIAQDFGRAVGRRVDVDKDFKPRQRAPQLQLVVDRRADDPRLVVGADTEGDLPVGEIARSPVAVGRRARPQAHQERETGRVGNERVQGEHGERQAQYHKQHGHQFGPSHLRNASLSP